MSPTICPLASSTTLQKIISNMMALPLAPLMNNLVLNDQSVFIKNKIIHDGFMYVHNLTIRLHKSKIQTLLCKLG
jgi:hypothetical protein